MARAGLRAGAIGRLARSTPVRLTLGIVLIFTVVSLATTLLAYLQMRENLRDALQSSVEQRLEGFSEIERADALMAAIRAEAATTDPETRVLVFIAPDGTQIGNARARVDRGKVALDRRGKEGSLSEHGYEVDTKRMAGGLLVVGESREQFDDMTDVFARLGFFSIVPTFVLCLLASIYIALRNMRRVSRIEATLDRLAEGHLDARVGGTGRGTDDVSRIGAGLDAMAEAQERSVAALKQVSADIAHDLKTPVQRISVLLSDLRDRLADDTAEAAIADRAAGEADRAVAVFQSLLQIAQIEGGSPRARFAPVDLPQILRTFADIYGPAAEDSGHDLALGPLPADPALVFGEKGLLGQVVANLIENALRHTPAGSRIVLSVMRGADGRLALAVADNGPGVPAAERRKVLDRLYRLETSRTTPGNGLGLSLVNAIADLHGAALVLEDNAPGLRVRLTFPPIPVAARTASAPPQPRL